MIYCAVAKIYGFLELRKKVEREIGQLILKQIVLFGFILAGCSSPTNEKSKIVQDVQLGKITYSRLDGISGDIFSFEMMTKNNLSKLYLKENYKYSHIKCKPIQDYIVIGSVSVDGEHLEHGMYISSGYFKVCEDESMNTCLRKKQIEVLLTDNLSCWLVVGGLFQKSKIIADSIVIMKDSIIESRNL